MKELSPRACKRTQTQSKSNTQRYLYHNIQTALRTFRRRYVNDRYGYGVVLRCVEL